MTDRRCRWWQLAFAAVTALILPIAGCSSVPDEPSPEATPPTSSMTVTGPPAAAPVVIPSCVVPEPPEWTSAIVGSTVETGGVSTQARAVAPGGEVLAVRDNGDTRDVLLIGTDRSVREVYSVPEPNTYNVGYAGIDERWIVLAVERIPRNSNGVLPTIKRIEIMDRADGSIRTVAAQSEADQAVTPELNAIDSVVLHDGKVYWLTKDTYASDTGTVRSFDPATGTTTDVESGPMRDLRADAGGVSWSPPGPGVGALKLPADLPDALDVVAEADRVSLGTDGTAYGWIVGVQQGGTGVGYWSPGTGAVVVTELDLTTDDYIPPVLVYGPFVVVDKGFSAGGADALGVFVDTRSGAVTGLDRREGAQYDMVVDARDGVLAVDVWTGPDKGDTGVGVLGPGGLPALGC